MNLFYFTASNKDAREHLNDTIINYFPITSQDFGLSDSLLNELRDAGYSDNVKMWGADPGPNNARNWGRIQKGDRVLVYSKGRFLFYASVIAKTHNPRLAENAWGFNKESKTWEYIYFLDDVREVNFDRCRFAGFFGYQSSFIPQGFNFINREIIENIRSRFGSIDEAIDFLNNPSVDNAMDAFKATLDTQGERELENSILEMDDEKFNSYIQTLDHQASLEVKEGLIKVRKYNKKLIDDLKDRYSHKCQVCGESGLTEYGVSIAEAHHIERFSLTQNNSPENILILCPNHHRLIHKAKGIFNKKSKDITYENGFVESLLLNNHIK